MNLKGEILDLFLQKDILRYNLKITVKVPSGNFESGEGEDVARDVLCSFFNEFLTSYGVGCDEVVPAIRHTILKEHWQAVLRIILYGVRLGYFPLRLSQTFMISCLFGEEHVTDEMLEVSFKNYFSNEERQSIEKMLKQYKEEKEEDLLDVLSAYNCFKKPSKDLLFSLLRELGHQKTEIYRKCYCGNVQILPTITKPFSELFYISFKDSSNL